MATFNHIGIAEPSTLTGKIATITQTRNSSVMHQEILSIGDPDSSAAITAVLNTTPASTAWGLVTREAGGFLSSVGGIVQIQGNSTVVLSLGALQSTSAPTSGSSGLIVRIASGPSSAVDLQMRPVFSSTQADNRVTVYQSSYTELLAHTLPGSTAWASSAGFHFNSSGDLQVVGTFSLSSLSSLAGNVLVSPNTTVATNPFPVRISDGSTWVTDYVQASTFTSTAVAGGVNFLRAGVAAVTSTDVFVMPWGSTYGHQIIAVTDSSQAVVYTGDSANNALRVNVVAGAAGGSTIVTIAALPLISSAVVAGNSSALTVRNVWSSTSTDQPVSAAQAGTWTVNLGTHIQSSVAPAGNSSGIVVRIASGPSSAADCTIRAVLSSTSADNPVLATLGTNLQSSVAPSSNSSGLIVRQVIDAILTTASSNAFSASTSLSIQSSGAALRSYVVAYSILSTVAGPSKVKFYSSGTMIWPVIFAALSSAVSGANLAVSAPAYLFRTTASEALTLQLGGGASTIVGFQVAVSYFRAP